MFEAKFETSGDPDSNVFKEDIIDYFKYNTELNWGWRSILREIKNKGITYDKNVKGSGDKDKGKRGAIKGYKIIEHNISKNT